MKKRLGITALYFDSFKPFGKQVFFFEDMERAMLERNFEVFYFSPLDWNDNQDMVKGYIFTNNEWQQVTRPIPHLIYERAFSTNEKVKAQIQYCLQQLTKKGHRFLNPLTLNQLLTDKYHFHQYLAERNISTILATKLSVFITMLPSQGRFFIKPNRGSRGRGVHQLYCNHDTFEILVDGATPQRFNNNELKTYLQALNEQDDFIVQEAAQIIPYQKRTWDIRCLVQNQNMNDYQAMGMGVRIGANNNITSNINSGGDARGVEHLEDFFLNEYNLSINEVKEKTQGLCLQATQQLHKTFGSFLEIGFDILWTADKGAIILEANARPSRWSFVKIADYLRNLGEDASPYLNLRKQVTKTPLVYTQKLLEHGR